MLAAATAVPRHTKFMFEPVRHFHFLLCDSFVTIHNLHTYNVGEFAANGTIFCDCKREVQKRFFTEPFGDAERFFSFYLYIWPLESSSCMGEPNVSHRNSFRRSIMEDDHWNARPFFCLPVRHQTPVDAVGANIFASDFFFPFLFLRFLSISSFSILGNSHSQYKEHHQQQQQRNHIVCVCVPVSEHIFLLIFVWYLFPLCCPGQLVCVCESRWMRMYCELCLHNSTKTCVSKNRPESV